MSKLRVHCFSISLDGFGAGASQDFDNPLGRGGEGLHPWLLGTRTFHQMIGGEGGATGVDDDFAARGNENIGAWILGRNMFAHSRGPWTDDQWKGWWGDNPPYHVPVFVLTHHARKPIPMAGGTTFYFVTSGILEALKQARDAAGGKDVRLGGGTATVRQYLRASLVDEMHIAVSPVLLGSGEKLLEGIDLPKLGYELSGSTSTPAANHFVVKKRAMTSAFTEAMADK
jgi:dihydrofolate reductase